MPKWIEFHETKPNGTTDRALGSDGTIRVDARLNVSSIRYVAEQHATSLKGVGKEYTHFRVLSGERLGNARGITSLRELSNG